MNYIDFLARKERTDTPTGLSVIPALNSMLFDQLGAE